MDFLGTVVPTQFFLFFCSEDPTLFFLRQVVKFFLRQGQFFTARADFFFFFNYLSMLFPCSIDTGFTRTFKTNQIRLGRREAVWGVYKDYTPQRELLLLPTGGGQPIPYRIEHRSLIQR